MKNVAVIGWLSKSGALVLTVSLLVILASANSASAVPAGLDPGFDGDGKLTTPIGSAGATANDLAVQPADGKLVAVGVAADGTTDGFAVARYDADGSLDSGFDGDGKVITDLVPSESSGTWANAVAIQPDGKIVVAGAVDTGVAPGRADFGVVRYNADGSLDASFDADGKVTTDFDGLDDRAHALVVQPDGKIVVAGTIAADQFGVDYDAAVVRYNADGSLDESFDGDGKLNMNFGDPASGTSIEGIRSLALQDGKLVAAGYQAYDGGTSWEFALARYNADGSLDESFDGDGKLISDLGQDRSEFANALLIQPDGKLVVAGQRYNETSTEFALARYNPDGSFDSSFSEDGRLHHPIGSVAPRVADEAYDLAIQPDGKIVAAGSTGTPAYNDEFDRYHPENLDFAVTRYKPNGTLDASFDGDGKLVTSVGPYTNEARAIAFQPDGKLVAAGHARTETGVRFALVRYMGFSEPPDTTPPDTTVNSGPSGFVRSTSASFGFSSSESGSSFKCSLDGAAYSSCTSPKSYSALTNGSHTFRVRATDPNGNTDPTPASRTWTVDTVVPRGTISINGGNASTASRSVTLRLSASDPTPASGVAYMRFRNENTTTWSSWQAYATSKAWTLSSGAGTKTVYVQYQDRAGNVSTLARDTIQYAP